MRVGIEPEEPDWEIVGLSLPHGHERGMVHSGIKPGNRILARQGGHGLVKMLEFGPDKASSEVPGDVTRDRPAEGEDDRP